MQKQGLCGVEETGGAAKGLGSTDKGTDMSQLNQLYTLPTLLAPIKHSKLGGNQTNTKVREKKGKAWHKGAATISVPEPLSCEDSRPSTHTPNPACCASHR